MLCGDELPRTNYLAEQHGSLRYYKTLLMLSESTNYCNAALAFRREHCDRYESGVHPRS